MNDSDFVDWTNRLRKSMKGYWVDGDGVLSVTFYEPSLWERFVEGLHSRSWVRYEQSPLDSRGAK